MEVISQQLEIREISIPIIIRKPPLLIARVEISIPIIIQKTSLLTAHVEIYIPQLVRYHPLLHDHMSNIQYSPAHFERSRK